MEVTYQEDDYLPLSGVQHYAFCPRQWALIHVEQLWVDNERTVDGDRVHERCHDESIRERRGGLLIVRGLKVRSRILGLSGICDVVEFRRGEGGTRLHGEEGVWLPKPIEYKRGGRKVGDEDRLQVCAQAIALEEMFCCKVESGSVYYDSERGREDIALGKDLRDELQNLVNRMHEDFLRGYTPKPRRRRHCAACSLVDICEPKLGKAPSVDRYMDTMIGVESS